MFGLFKSLKKKRKQDNLDNVVADAIRYWENKGTYFDGMTAVEITHFLMECDIELIPCEFEKVYLSVINQGFLTLDTN